MTRELHLDGCEVCGAKLPEQARRGGRRRRYCCGRCRSAASRARRAPLDLTDCPPAVAEDPLVRTLMDRSASTDDQCVAALQMMLAMASVCRRLGSDARPNLRWRYAETADRLDELLHRLFGVDPA